MADVRITAIDPDGNVVPVLANDKGELKLEEPVPSGDITGNLTVTGSGTFGESGQFGQEIRCIRANGNRVNLGGSDSIAIFENTGNFIINWDGSGTFKGNITLNGPATQYILAPNVIVDSGYTAAKQTLNGDTFIQTGTDGSTTTANIAANGSATFAGTGQFGNFINLSSNGKVKVGNAGDANAASIEIVAGTAPAAASYTLINGLQSDGSTSAFDIKANGTLQCVYLTDGSTTKSMTDVLGGVTTKIHTDGSVTFAGGKCGFTADGRLWVTDNKNDTVITLREQNGLMSWEQYSPPVLNKEIDQGFGVNPETNSE